ncbi:MAG: TldD/PmbA family protein [Candidatus Hermodarchaeota archaeon]
MEFENLKDELLATIDTSLKFTKTVDNKAEFEIYLYFQNQANISINQGVVQASDGIVAGSAIRVVKGSSKHKKISFTSASGLDIHRIKKNIEEAVFVNNAVNVEDRRFESFCTPKTPVGKEGVLADEILAVTSSDLVPKCLAMIKEAESVDERIKQVSTSMNAAWGGFAIGNTNGVQQASRSATNSGFVFCLAIDGDERKESFHFDISRDKLIEFEGVGQKTAEKTLKLLGGKEINETTTLPTIWDPTAAASFVQASLGQSIIGSNVVEKMSPLVDKIGDQIASPTFNLVDDGQKPTGLGTNVVDSEGYPQQRSVVIDKGVLKTFLFDTYYASIFGGESTGNCSRGGIFGSTIPYEDPPSNGVTNLETSSGTKTEEELIASIDGQAILIREMPMGIFHSSVTTGEFSAIANSAFLIEKGEITTPLKVASISGSFYEGLKNIIEVGSNKQVTYLGVEIPSLLIDGFSIVM